MARGLASEPNADGKVWVNIKIDAQLVRALRKFQAHAGVTRAEAIEAALELLLFRSGEIEDTTPSLALLEEIAGHLRHIAFRAEYPLGTRRWRGQVFSPVDPRTLARKGAGETTGSDLPSEPAPLVDRIERILEQRGRELRKRNKGEASTEQAPGDT